MSRETLRGHTLKIGERLRAAPAVNQAAEVSGITVTTDSTFIRSRDDGERHLEVRVGADALRGQLPLERGNAGQHGRDHPAVWRAARRICWRRCRSWKRGACR